MGDVGMVSPHHPHLKKHDQLTNLEGEVATEKVEHM